MNISTRTRYGFRLMIYLGKNSNGNNVQLSEIAKSEDISMKYLEKIVQILKRSGLVRVTRGAKGGYRLSRAVEDIKASELFSVLEGSTAILDCIDSGECASKDRCSGFDLWEGLSRTITDYLGKHTLKDLVDNNKNENMYYI